MDCGNGFIINRVLANDRIEMENGMTLKTGSMTLVVKIIE
jgi:hypothetical protein